MRVKKICTYLFTFLCLIVFVSYCKPIESYAASQSPALCLGIGNGQYIQKGHFLVYGWAAYTGGVKEVDVNISGSNSKTATLKGNVSNFNYPGYSGSDSQNFMADYNSIYDSLGAGSYKLNVTVKGNDGGAKSWSITINKAPQIVKIEDTKPNGSSEYVKGYTVCPSGTQKVDFYLDGGTTPVKTVTSFSARPDIVYNVDKNGQMGYGFANAYLSGFAFNFNLNSISQGTHKITAVATGSDGRTASTVNYFNVSKPSSSAALCLGVGNGQYIQKGHFLVYGWAAYTGGVKEVDVNISGSNSKTATLKGNVSNFNYPGYSGSDSQNFMADYNSIYDSLGAGSYKLNVTVKGNDGGTKSWSITINKAPQIVKIEDTKQNGSSEYVKGYTVCPSGTQKVDYYLDGGTTPVKTVTSFSARPDIVYNVDKNGQMGYGFANAYLSGFAFNFNLNLINSGTHKITAVATGADGKSASTVNYFNVSKPSAALCLGLANGQYIQEGKFIVYGWSAYYGGVSEVDVSVDGGNTKAAALTGNASISAPYSGYKSTDSENFNANFNSIFDSLSSGSHSVSVTVKGIDGSTRTWQITVYKASLQMRIEMPRMSQFFDNGNNIEVRGWAVSPAGLNRIEFYLDGSLTPFETLTSFVKRPDIEININKYGKMGYLSNDAYLSGFDINVNTNIGPHKIKVVMVDKAGKIGVETVTIDVTPNIKNDAYTFTTGTLASVNGVSVSTIDPNQILTHDYGMFEFMSLYDNNNGDYITSHVSADDLNKMLAGCGSIEGHGQTFWDAAKKYNINPVYLVAHSILETGRGTSKLANGENPQGVFIHYYNVFGYGAVDWDPVNGGNSYAVKHNWYTVDDAITGGVSAISYNYINNSQLNKVYNVSYYYDQATLYDMKWDPEHTQKHGDKSTTEYATDLDWASSIAGIINDYTNLFSGVQLHFEIPLFA